MPRIKKKKKPSTTIEVFNVATGEGVGFNHEHDDPVPFPIAAAYHFSLAPTKFEWDVPGISWDLYDGNNKHLGRLELTE